MFRSQARRLPRKGLFRRNNRPVYPALSYPQPTTPRPAYRGNSAPNNAPPGHLGSWLNEHRNVPVQDKEKMLRKRSGLQQAFPGTAAAPDAAVQQREQDAGPATGPAPGPRRESGATCRPSSGCRSNRSARQWTRASLRPPIDDEECLPRSALGAADQRQTVLNSAATRASSRPRSAASSPTSYASSRTSLPGSHAASSAPTIFHAGWPMS